MNNLFLVPANAKKGTLIFNIFRPFDLILLIVGMGISFALLMIIPTTNIVMVITACLPGCICGLLVIPIPHYHNVLCTIQSIINFFNSTKKYHWRGWCFYERYSETTKK